MYTIKSYIKTVKETRKQREEREQRTVNTIGFPKVQRQKTILCKNCKPRLSKIVRIAASSKSVLIATFVYHKQPIRYVINSIVVLRVLNERQ